MDKVMTDVDAYHWHSQEVCRISRNGRDLAFRPLHYFVYYRRFAYPYIDWVHRQTAKFLYDVWKDHYEDEAISDVEFWEWLEHQPITFTKKWENKSLEREWDKSHQVRFRFTVTPHTFREFTGEDYDATYFYNEERAIKLIEDAEYQEWVINEDVEEAMTEVEW